MALTFTHQAPVSSTVGQINRIVDVNGNNVIASATGAWVYSEVSNWTESPGTPSATGDDASRLRDHYSASFSIPGVYLTRTPFRRIWSSASDPTKWKLGLDATTEKDSPVVALSRPSKALKIGDIVNFIETLDNEDAETEIINEATIVAISSNRKKLTLSKSATTASTGFLVRSTYASEQAGYDDSMITGGNTVMRIISLGEAAIVCHDAGFLVMTPTGDAASPFITTEGYTGTEGLWLKWCAAVMDDKLIYRSKNRWLSVSLLSMTPAPVELLDNVRALFDGLTLKDTETTWCSYNAIDRELWMFLPQRLATREHGQVVCYSAETKTVHTINAFDDRIPVAFTGSGTVVRANTGTSGAEDWWWLLGTTSGRMVLMHVDRLGNPLTLRFGYEYSGEINYGYFDSGHAECRFSGHMIELSPDSPQDPNVEAIFSSFRGNPPADVARGRCLFEGTRPRRIKLAIRGIKMSERIRLTPPPTGALPAISRRVIDAEYINSESPRR